MKKLLLCVLVFMMIVSLGMAPLAQSAGAIEAASTTATIQVDFTKTKQTMDGFGFFGAQDVWWGNGPFYSDAWLEKILGDLGITIWRNEIAPYNPVDSSTVSNPQSANWNKQRPMVQALKNKADALGVPLKVILSVWSPPGEFKINSTELGAYPNNWATRDGVHNSTLNGGTMNPLKYNEYARWIISALDMYKKIGIDVYAVSLQNEPLFVETYNSCVYTSQWYVELINNVIPTVKASYPNVKVFGSENMLEGEASNPDAFYTGAMISDAAALNSIDIFAFHGYADGVQATAIAKHKTLWESVLQNFYQPTKKPSWMTETSGFSENWLANGTTPGALDLGLAINSALKYGQAAGWVYWQGSEPRTNAQSVYSLMSDLTVGKRYYVSKHFYRYIRPGAVMVDSTTTDADILSTSFYNDASKTFTSVLINSSAVDKTVTLSGTNVPASFTAYLTTAIAGQNCSDMGVVTNGAISLPANSIMTLVSQTTFPFVTPAPTPTPKPTLAPSTSPYPVQAPLKPTIRYITNFADTIFGTAMNGGRVKVAMGSKIANAEIYAGQWDVSMAKPLKAGTKVMATTYLYNGKHSGTKILYVVPAAPNVNPIKHAGGVVAGTATKGSAVQATIGSKKYTSYANAKTGRFNIKIPINKKGTPVSIRCRAGGFYSVARTYKMV